MKKIYTFVSIISTIIVAILSYNHIFNGATLLFIGLAVISTVRAVKLMEL